MTGAKCTEIKMWKICTEKMQKSEFKCTEKYGQYKQGFWFGLKFV